MVIVKEQHILSGLTKSLAKSKVIGQAFVELKSRRKTIFDYYKEGKLPSNHIPVEENGKIYIKHHEHSYLELPHPFFKPVIRKTLDVYVRGGRWD